MQHSFYNLKVTPYLYNAWHLVPALVPAERSAAFQYNQPSPFYGGQNQGALDWNIQQHAYAPYYTPNFTQLLNNINTEMAKVMSGGESIDAAIKNAANQTRQTM